MSPAASQTSLALPEPGSVDLDGLRHMLGAPGLSHVTAWRLEKLGHLKRVPVVRMRLWTVQSVRDFIAGKTCKTA